MTRARSPLDALEPLPMVETNNSIPVSNQPWMSIGQVVKGIIWNDLSFYLRELLKNSGTYKAKEILNLLRHGQNLEFSVAGIEAYYAMPTIFVSNQCYLQNGQTHSGLQWHYKVLIKGVFEGRHVCVIPRVWISEADFIPLAETEFIAGSFYKSDRNLVYKCLIRSGEPVFVYFGHVRSDGAFSRDNHITPRQYTPYQRRHFQLFQLPEIRN